MRRLKSEFPAAISQNARSVPSQVEVAPDKFSLLSRYLNLVFIANATLFIGTRLVITHHYWFCLVANALVVAAYAIMLSPWSNLHSRRVYYACFTLAAVATLLTILSIAYWIHNGH